MRGRTVGKVLVVCGHLSLRSKAKAEMLDLTSVGEVDEFVLCLLIVSLSQSDVLSLVSIQVADRDLVFFVQYYDSLSVI